MNTLTLEEAAEFLHIHPVTLLGKIRSGEVPAAKPGKRYVLLDIDLIEYLRSQYPSRVMQGAHEEVKSCHSTNVRTLQCGGLKSAITEKSYKEALGLPTS